VGVKEAGMDCWERTFTVSGRALHARLCGDARNGPTFVLVYGTGVTSAFWGWLQPCLAAQGLALSYDRAGSGRSEPAPGESKRAKISTIASDLGDLLRQANLPGPYYLVGHSSGGLIVQYFAALHPQETAGIILIDPTPIETPSWFGASLKLTGVITRWIATRGDIGLLRAFNPFVRSLKTLPPADGAEIGRALASGRHLRAIAVEMASVPDFADAAGTHPADPALPVLVATAGAWNTPKVRRELEGNRKLSFQARIIRDHERIAARSTHGRHIIIDGSDHVTVVADKSFAARLCDEIVRFAKANKPA
jgi:pimeloyl-ACP methyl ester carboxylesterase